MTDLVADTLALMDDIYSPTDKAVRHRKLLADAADAPEVELPYYVAQLSLMLTLMENLSTSKTIDEMREHIFRASLAFTLALGLLNHSLGIVTNDAPPEEGVVH